MKCLISQLFALALLLPSVAFSASNGDKADRRSTSLLLCLHALASNGEIEKAEQEGLQELAKFGHEQELNEDFYTALNRIGSKPQAELKPYLWETTFRFYSTEGRFKLTDLPTAGPLIPDHEIAAKFKGPSIEGFTAELIRIIKLSRQYPTSSTLGQRIRTTMVELIQEHRADTRRGNLDTVRQLIDILASSGSLELLNLSKDLLSPSSDIEIRREALRAVGTLIVYGKGQIDSVPLTHIEASLWENLGLFLGPKEDAHQQRSDVIDILASLKSLNSERYDRALSFTNKSGLKITDNEVTNHLMLEIWPDAQNAKAINFP